jgi:hypothetical protein
MTRERLQLLSMEELLALARNEGYELSEPADRSTLIETILETLEEQRRERQEENNPNVRVEETKFEVSSDDELALAGADEFPIPKRYNQTRITFLVRDPHWAFAFWEIDDHDAARLKKSSPDQVMLRVHDVELLQYDGSSSNFSFDIPVRPTDSSWYIYLPNENCAYVLELGMLSGRRFTCLARSNVIRTPRETPAPAAPAGEGEQPGEAEILLELMSDLGDLESYSSSEIIPQRILSELKD